MQGGGGGILQKSKIIPLHNIIIVAGGDVHEVDPDQNSTNLLYVAVTRAKKHIVMSPTLLKVLQRAKVLYIVYFPQIFTQSSYHYRSTLSIRRHPLQAQKPHVQMMKMW